jgi:Protein of unknown function DUF58
MLFDPRSLIDPHFFSRLESIELRARSIVEGSMHGLHRSPYLGLSVEFASHREYAPGDDLRHLNWKLYARHDRLYIKEYDADTNLNLYLLLDASASMTCANTGRSKLHYAASLAAALARRALKQRDLSADGHIRFRDLESGETLTVQAEVIRQAYGQAVDEWRQALELECRKRAIDRIELTTTDAPDIALLDYLVKRAKTF